MDILGDYPTLPGILLAGLTSGTLRYFYVNITRCLTRRLMMFVIFLQFRICLVKCTPSNHRRGLRKTIQTWPFRCETWIPFQSYFGCWWYAVVHINFRYCNCRKYFTG